MKRATLLLGGPESYEVSKEVKTEELQQMKQVQEDLKSTLLAFRARYGMGRAIATSQIRAKKCVIYRHLDTPVLFISPRLPFPEQDTIDVPDDCMLSPDLLIRAKWHKRYIIYYKDLGWNDCSTELEGGMSELTQHKYTHLDGVLVTPRVVDERAFVMKPH